MVSLILEAHPIDPGILYCCYTANNNDWSHRQQPKYHRFVVSSLAADHLKRKSSERGKLNKMISFLSGFNDLFTFFLLLVLGLKVF